MNPEIETIYKRMVQLQRDRLQLLADVESVERKAREEEEALFAELFEVLDVFDAVLERVEPRFPELGKSVLRAFKSLQAVRRKLDRLLEDRAVTPITFPHQRVVLGRCRVVETQPHPASADGAILKIVRTGYARGDQVLRPADVIAVKNE